MNSFFGNAMGWEGVCGISGGFALQLGRMAERLNIWDLVSVATYGLLGIALAVIGYVVFDMVTPFSLGRELVENRNIAVGIVIAGIIIGISIIIAAVVS